MKFKTFCAANSGDGFISFFDTILDEKKYQIFYIKGGPGCGKSTLMKSIANRADNAELIYCSGDPESLDGVILPKQKAIIMDATNPHSFEPKYPGIGGNIIDLGEGWNPDKMNKNNIIKLCDQKKEIYHASYALLKSAKEIHNAVFSQIAKNVDKEKLHKIGNKILLQNALWENHNRLPKVQKRFLSAITPDGTHTLAETFEILGKNVILLDDRWMISGLLFEFLDQQLSARGIDHINSYHPLLGKQILHHIIIPQASLSIITKDGFFDFPYQEEKIIRKINLQSVIFKEHLDSNKNKFMFLKKLQKDILQSAIEKLDSARKIHMNIEHEYAAGTNFDATEHLKQNLIIKLFSKS